MPKYKSRLKKTKKTKAGSVKKEQVMLGTDSSTYTPKNLGGKLPNIENIFGKKPENLLHFLHMTPQPQKVFQFIKEVAGQKIGKPNKYFPKFTNPISKSHVLYPVYNDIQKNATNLSHLSTALQDEIEDEPKGGSLWSSIYNTIKSGFDFVKKIPEKAKNIGKYTKKGIQYMKPIAKGIDLASLMFGEPLDTYGYINSMDSYLDKLPSQIDEIEKIIKDPAGLIDEAYDAYSKPIPNINPQVPAIEYAPDLD